jgi:hypothetical protein
MKEPPKIAAIVNPAAHKGGTISHRTSQSRWLKKLGEIAYLLMTCSRPLVANTENGAAA